jgi:Arc/MetJ-type ribon-helix-helix transcriptional regulator
MTNRDTLILVAEAISLRLDDQTRRALLRLQQTGLSQSEAVRKAVIDAAEALTEPTRLAAEIAALDADPKDRAEMKRLVEYMEMLGE